MCGHLRRYRGQRLAILKRIGGQTSTSHSSEKYIDRTYASEESARNAWKHKVITDLKKSGGRKTGVIWPHKDTDRPMLYTSRNRSIFLDDEDTEDEDDEDEKSKKWDHGIRTTRDNSRRVEPY